MQQHPHDPQLTHQQGHHLWNAGRVFASYLESNPTTTHSKSVLELGAGAGLPSLLSSILGATSVLVTDYPDAELISNLHHNISHCALLAQPVSPTKIQAKGYLWGADVTPLLATLPGNEKGFDVLILADLLFNHSEHGKLLESIQKTLKREVRARALVFFTPYRPWLLERDLAFFDMAAEGGFEVEKIFERVMDRVMFEEDRGVSISNSDNLFCFCSVSVLFCSVLFLFPLLPSPPPPRLFFFDFCI